LFSAGIATFAQLYSPQSVLPLLAADLKVERPTPRWWSRRDPVVVVGGWTAVAVTIMGCAAVAAVLAGLCRDP
jgi:hypothetical protein